MKYIFSIICFLSAAIVSAQMTDPGSWKIKTRYQSSWTAQKLHGNGIIRDTVGFTIKCDTSTRTISFIQSDGEVTEIPYTLIETYREDTRYMRGVFYYHTVEWGDIIYHPGEMVVRNYPTKFRLEFYN